MMMAPPGWYPDPWGVGGSRWWDGAQWTVHLSGYPASQQAGMALARLHAVWNVERRMSQWARAAVCGYGLALIVEATLFFVLGGQLRRQLHAFFHQLRTAPNNGVYTTPNLHLAVPGGGFDAFLDLFLSRWLSCFSFGSTTPRAPHEGWATPAGCRQAWVSARGSFPS